MKQLTDKNFIDWFSEYLGYGYGTGEEYTIPALKGFLEACTDGRSYDHEYITEKIGGASTWFLMNVLCKTDLIEYGTSPRFGWLTERGIMLRNYVSQKSEDELYELVMVDSDYTHCSPNYCNCGKNGYEEGRKCDNPLFIR